MKKFMWFAMLGALLAGCGVGETAVTAAAGGTSKAQEIEQAKQMKEDVRQQLDQASLQAQQRMQDAESAAAQ